MDHARRLLADLDREFGPLPEWPETDRRTDCACRGKAPQMRVHTTTWCSKMVLPTGRLTEQDLRDAVDFLQAHPRWGT